MLYKHSYWPFIVLILFYVLLYELQSVSFIIIKHDDDDNVQSAVENFCCSAPWVWGTGTLWCLQKEMATYRLTYLCPCGETQTMFHTVESCSLIKLNGGYLSYTLRMKTPFRGWPVMIHDAHTRRRSVRYYTGWRFGLVVTRWLRST